MPDPGTPIVIIGTGAAGLAAARAASARGGRVIVLERNRKAGIKLLISGGGKCNVTHEGNEEELLAAFPVRQKRFLKPSLYRCSGEAVRSFLRDEGVTTFARDNGRVFPASGRAEDIVTAFLRALRRAQVEIRLNARVTRLLVDEQGIAGVIVDGSPLATRSVLIATGGVSYPKTGTTGDGITWANELGHTIVPLQPALAPIRLTPDLPSDWRGVALRGGALSVVSNGRQILRRDGDVLFTHEGLSGPAALDCSNAAATTKDATIVWDFFPRMEEGAVDQLLLDRITGERARFIQAQLFEFMPNRIVPDILRSVGVPPETRGYNLTAAQRKRIVRMLKGWAIGRVQDVNIERGEVTAGGVALDEVDPRTLSSRRVRGLFFAGEVLDIDGPIGGYNLQAAFSTGTLAGDHLVDMRP